MSGFSILIYSINIYFILQMEIFIGIDQSINSTGVTIQCFEREKLIQQHFYIIKTNKLTKKEKIAQENIDGFDYILYHKWEKDDAKDNNEFELHKLENNINISNEIINLIKQYAINKLDKIYVAMEGISFQSSNKTQSIIDLSGLSTLIRYRIYKYFESNQDHMGSLKIFTPSEVKKFATGNGMANKEVMVNLFKTNNKKFAMIPKLDDMADSYWICSYMRKIYCDEYGL